MVSGGTQSIGGVVSAVDQSAGQPIANYGTAVGNGIQVGLNNQNWADGVTTGVTNAGIVA